MFIFIRVSEFWLFFVGPPAGRINLYFLTLMIRYPKLPLSQASFTRYIIVEYLFIFRDGKMAFYSLDDEHIKNLFDEVLRHVEER